MIPSKAMKDSPSTAWIDPGKINAPNAVKGINFKNFRQYSGSGRSDKIKNGINRGKYVAKSIPMISPYTLIV